MVHTASYLKSTFLTVLISLIFISSVWSSSKENPVILQAFYWNIGNPGSQHEEPESNLWQHISTMMAKKFKDHGFSHIWLPPTGKAFNPVNQPHNSGYFSRGYAVYDHYDLGEFHQQGSIRTKYGTKSELHEAVDAMHSHGLKVIADVVMNHMMGTTSYEYTPISDSFRYDEHTSNVVHTENLGISSPTYFNFLNQADPTPRGTKYSSFVWNKKHFDGMEAYGVYYLLEGKKPDKVNYLDNFYSPAHIPELYNAVRSDISIGMDLDFQNLEVQEEMIKWTKWLIDEVGFDGIRIDSIDKIHTPFLHKWANEIKEHSKNKSNFLIFGESWDGWNERLNAYLNGRPENNNLLYNSGQNVNDYCGINKSISLFDVPLHYDFQKIAKANPSYPSVRMFNLPERGLVAKNKKHAITFVDSLDTVPTQSLASYIPVHTKLQAYTFILLNEHGTPSVFYRDMYKGNFVDKHVSDSHRYLHDGIKSLLDIRRKYAYGTGEYFRNPRKPGILGYRRYGNENRSQSGLIYLIREHNSTDQDLWIDMSGQDWELKAGHGQIRDGRFYLPHGSNWAVWAPKN